MRYLITFPCYGAHLHGKSGSVDRFHNVPGGRFAPENTARADASRRRMAQPPYLLCESSRAVVLKSIREVCACRGWELFAAHARRNHVHVVVEADATPAIVMTTLKAYASRALNAVETCGPERRRWARHASTVTLFRDEAVREAIRYVVERQGEAMAVYVGEWR